MHIKGSYLKFSISISRKKKMLIFKMNIITFYSRAKYKVPYIRCIYLKYIVK